MHKRDEWYRILARHSKEDLVHIVIAKEVEIISLNKRIDDLENELRGIYE